MMTVKELIDVLKLVDSNLIVICSSREEDSEPSPQELNYSHKHYYWSELNLEDIKANQKFIKL